MTQFMDTQSECGFHTRRLAYAVELYCCRCGYTVTQLEYPTPRQATIAMRKHASECHQEGTHGHTRTTAAK